MEIAQTLNDAVASGDLPGVAAAAATDREVIFAGGAGVLQPDSVIWIASLTTPLLADPGERWEYGISMDWAGKMVEAASGQRLDRYMTEHIFTPLGMNDTAFAIGPAQRLRKAGMHARGPTGITVVDHEIPE